MNIFSRIKNDVVGAFDGPRRRGGERMNTLTVTKSAPQCPERVLWLAVLQLTIEDYAAGRLPWSYWWTADCLYICRMAGVHPHQIRELSREHTAKARRKRAAA